MEYIITLTTGNNRKILSKHDNIEDAKKAGEKAYEKSNRGDVVSCISFVDGRIREDGKIEGKYKLYECWY